MNAPRQFDQLPVGWKAWPRVGRLAERVPKKHNRKEPNSQSLSAGNPTSPGFDPQCLLTRPRPPKRPRTRRCVHLFFRSLPTNEIHADPRFGDPATKKSLPAGLFPDFRVFCCGPPAFKRLCPCAGKIDSNSLGPGPSAFARASCSGTQAVVFPDRKKQSPFPFSFTTPQ